MEEQEEWRDIPSWEGFYQASNLGRIKSLQRIVKQSNHTRLVRERIVKPSMDHKGVQGRPTVGLYRNGTPQRYRVQVLILEAFIGPRPDGMEACHNDGDKLNNRLDNLRWDTKKGNMQDRIAHGTYQYGENNPSVKLTNEKVLEIRAKAGTKLQRELADEYGTNQSHIGMIINRKIWKHI